MTNEQIVLMLIFVILILVFSIFIGYGVYYKGWVAGYDCCKRKLENAGIKLKVT